MFRRKKKTSAPSPTFDEAMLRLEELEARMRAWEQQEKQACEEIRKFDSNESVLRNEISRMQTKERMQQEAVWFALSPQQKA